MVKLTRLKDVRQRKALTQQQLAEKAGVNRVTIARIETGKDEPFPTTLRKVADALGVEPEELLEPVLETLPSKPPTTALANGKAAALPLDSRISVVDEDDVGRMLQAEPDLAPLINEAAEQLLVFIPDARLSLKHLVDPDWDEGEELLLSVSTDLEVDEALEALNRFDQEWWFANGRRARGLLIVDLR
jgi:transcriptional regulator with XRE-family HTH domain